MHFERVVSRHMTDAAAAAAAAAAGTFIYHRTLTVASVHNQ